MVIGYTGIFSKLMRTIPHAVIMAMLAGVLLTFGVKIFSSTRINPILGISMLLVFFAAKAIKFRAPVVTAFVVGVVVELKTLQQISQQHNMQGQPLLLRSIECLDLDHSLL